MSIEPTREKELNAESGLLLLLLLNRSRKSVFAGIKDGTTLMQLWNQRRPSGKAMLVGRYNKLEHDRGQPAGQDCRKA